MELSERGVWAEDLLSSERLLVRGRMKGEREAVSAMEARARPLRCDTSQHQSPKVAMGVGLQTVGAPVDPRGRIPCPGRKGWRGQKRPR